MRCMLLTLLLLAFGFDLNVANRTADAANSSDFSAESAIPKGDENAPPPGAPAARRLLNVNLLAQKSTVTNNSGPSSIQKKSGSPTPRKQFGRIEQLLNGPGATMPGLKMEIPKFDLTPPSGQDSTTPVIPGKISSDQPLTGYVTNSFPVDWKGSWSGQVSVIKFADNPNCWLGDALEMYSIRRINKPGRVGSIRCIFKSDDGLHLSLNPPTIVMQMNMARPTLGDILSGVAETQVMDPSLLNAEQGSYLRVSLKRPLGAAVASQNVNGNPISMNVMKNELRELDANTMEQDVLVQMNEFNKLMSKLSNSFNETVLRFSANGDQMDVEIAQVSYDTCGSFLSKTLFSGTLSKDKIQPTSGSSTTPSSK